MKKLISIFVILMLMLSMMAACGGEPDSEKGNENSGPNSKEIEQTSGSSDGKGTEEMGDLLSNAYVKMMKDDQYTLKYKTTMDFAGEKTEYLITVAVNGGEMAMINKGGGADNRIVTLEDKTYMIDDVNKTVLVMPIQDNSEVTAGTFETEGITYVGNGREDGLVYEEYTTQDSLIRYYFDGKELVKISISVEGTTMVMDILEMSSKVDDRMFNIPSDYEMTSM